MTSLNFIFILYCISLFSAAVALIFFVIELHRHQKQLKRLKELSQLLDIHRRKEQFERRMESMTLPGTCRYCGCTDLDCSSCIERTGEACYWINEEKTVCSACFNYH